MRILWEGIVNFIRESILLLYPIACTFFFSVLYLFVFIQYRFFAGKNQAWSGTSSAGSGMEFSVVEKINIRKDRCVKVGAFLYDPEIDGLYHESPWWFPVQIGITHGLSKCEVTPMFLKLPFIMKGWINQDILLRMIELLKLVEKDTILMHGSCVDYTLIVGMPNAGKTYQTYKTVAEGGKLISEEYTKIEWDGSKIAPSWWAGPYKPIMRTCFSESTLKAAKMKLTFKEKIWMACAKFRALIFPFMHEGVIWKELPASGEISPIRKIVYGSTGREVKDWKEFAILCENEFPFMGSEFLQAYAVASGFDILAIQEKQRKLIKEFVSAIYPNSVA